MMSPSSKKKEPRDQATASLYPSVPKDQSEARQVKSMRKRLIGGWAIPFPDWLFEHLDEIGPALPTLLILMRSAELRSSTWKGTEAQIAHWLKKSPRTVRTHLNILKSLGIERHQSANALVVRLPEKLNLSVILTEMSEKKRERREGKKLQAGRKFLDTRAANNFNQGGNKRVQPPGLDLRKNPSNNSRNP